VLLLAATPLRAVRGGGAGDPLAVEGSGSSAVKGFRLKLFTANDGLPQSQVTAIKQTRDGYLWLGTWIGLARFDGQNLKILNKFTTPELVSGEINGLTEDAEGTLWIATRGGLLSYRDHRFERIGTNQGLSTDELWRLQGGQQGVWVEGADVLVRVQHGRIQSTRLPRGGAILSMCERSEGGLHMLIKEQWLTWLPEQGLIRTNFTADSDADGWNCAVFDPDGKSAWIGSGRSLYRLSEGKLTPEPIIDGKTDDVSLLYRDREGNLWAHLKTRGLFRRANGIWEMIVPATRLPTGATCFEQDEEGNLWAGTGQGMLQIQPTPIKTFGAAEGLPNNEARSVCEDEEGTIWVLTLRGLARIRGNRVLPLNVEEPGYFFEGKSVWPRKGGGVWIGKVGPGIQDFSKERFHDWEGRIPASAVSAMCEDKAGRLWIAASEGLVSIAGEEIICHSNIFPGAVRPNIYGLAGDSEGAIWIGTKHHGLAHLVNGHCSIFSEKQGLGPGAVFSIHEDAEKTLWLGTENGLVRFKDGRFFTFGPAQGLLERNINCVLEDDFGYVWLSGLHGIYAIERTRLNEVADGRVGTVPCFAAGEADGMVIVESNGGENQPAGWKARDGRLWFPTLAGVVAIDPRTIRVRELPPKIHIEQVKANDEALLPGANSRASGECLKIKAGARLIEFNYTATTFVEPERARFRHRLVGSEGQWCEATAERTVRYYNLRPGKYRFEVLGANHHNIWNTEPAVFEFSLAPFFWQTWTFYGLCAAAVVGLAALAHRYRLQWQHRLLKLEEQRALSNERSRIARDLHDDIGGSLTGIALQLEAARRRGRANKEELAVLAEETRGLSRELRELAWTTNPRCDNAGSLAAFIGESTERFCRAAGVECRLKLPATDGAEEVPARVRYELLAVLKESLANTAKHAKARTVTVDLAANNGDLWLTIKDDGSGFDPGREAPGMGLRNLRERVQQAGGWVNVESKPGCGTTIIARLPINKKDTD
jgi:signal transduction histidine kinase/streptogramin lyase